MDDGGALVDEDRRDAGKHLLEVLLEPRDVLRVADDLEQVFVADEVEPREGGSLALQVFAEGLLDLGQQVGQPFE